MTMLFGNSAEVPRIHRYPMLRCLLASIVTLAVAQPSSAGIIIDNFTETSPSVFTLRSTFFGTASTTRAQQFNTGGLSYSLDSISVQILRDTAASDFAAQLWTANGNTPDTAVLNLSLANSPPAGPNETYVFTPNAHFVMNPSQDYFFSIENKVGLNSFVHATPSTSNNYVGPGTLISNVASSTDSGANWTTFTANEFLFRLEGTFVPEPSAFGCFSLIAAACAGFRRRRRP